jgi:MFS family permease
MDTTFFVKSRRLLREFSFFHGNLLVLAVSGAFSSLGAGMISVYMPKYFLSLRGDTLTLGLIGAMIAVVQFFMLPLGGLAADYYGRRKILVATAFYGILFPFLYFILQDWRLFAVVSVCAALGSLSGPAWHAMVADSVPPEKRTSGIATLQVLSSLPQVIAPFIWGWLIENLGWIEGFKAGCLYSIVTAFISALILGIFLKETLKKQSTAKLELPNNNSFVAGFSEIRHSLSTSLKALIIAYVFVVLANGAVGQYYIIYATDEIQLTALQWSIIVSLQFLSASVLKIPGAWVADKFGKRKVLIISVLSCAPFTILFTLSRSFAQVLVVMLLLVVTGIYYGPTHEALQADLTPRKMRGRITALWNIGGALGAASGALVGGWMFQTINPIVPFYFFTAAELTALIFLVVAVREPLKKEV